MKIRKLLIIFLILIIGFFSIYLLISTRLSSRNNQNQLKTINYVLEGKKYKLLVAENPKEWERGLMFVKPERFKHSNQSRGLLTNLFKMLQVRYDRKALVNDYDGMIFIFPDKKRQSFWNKNTYLDLDVYWIDGNRVVGKSFLPSVKKSKEIVVVESGIPVNKAIELIK